MLKNIKFRPLRAAAAALIFVSLCVTVFYMTSWKTLSSADTILVSATPVWINGSHHGEENSGRQSINDQGEGESREKTAVMLNGGDNLNEEANTHGNVSTEGSSHSVENIEMVTKFKDSESQKLKDGNIKPKSKKASKRKVFANETFHYDDGDGRTEIWTLMGDARVDARRNLVVLYVTNNSTRRSINVTKPYPRKWDHPLMDELVHEIVIMATDPPADLEEWEPAEVAKPDDPRLTKYRNISIHYPTFRENSTVIPLGNGSRWDDPSWKFLKTQGLPASVTQLSVIDLERQERGGRMVTEGGVFEENGAHAWVVFNGRKEWVTKKSMEASKKVPSLACDFKHRVPGYLFSAGGYSGNLFHTFNEILIPLYISSQQLKGEFVMVMEASQLWWLTKYELLLRQLSNYPVVLMGKERAVHCFREVKVGFRIHGTLTIEKGLFWYFPPEQQGSMEEFQEKMGSAWDGFPVPEAYQAAPKCKPVLTILSRTRTRVWTNEQAVRAMAERLGFFVVISVPNEFMGMEEIWKQMQNSDVVIAVHGAAMTNLIFMRPKSTLIQIVPLGVETFAQQFYGEPAEKLGLLYTKYNVEYEESSLSKVYSRNDSIISDPGSVFKNGWGKVKDIFLAKQNVTVNLKRFGKLLSKTLVDVRKDPAFVSRTSSDCKQ